MGNCQDCCAKGPKVNKGPKVLFLELIDKNYWKDFRERFVKDLKFKEFIENYLDFQWDGIYMNALGIAYVKNRPKFVKALMENEKMFEEMMKGFKKQKFSLMNYLCSNDYVECVKILIKDQRHLDFSKSNSVTIDFEEENRDSIIEEFPIIVAAMNGSIKTINLFYSININLRTPHKDTSFDTCNEKGENVELIACRAANFPLVRFLHEDCGRQFKTVNRSNENALVVCLATRNKGNCYPTFKYLLETVKVDMENCYQDLLILGNYQPLKNYIQEKLKQKGINVKTEDYLIDPESFSKKDEFFSRSRIFTPSFLNDLRRQSLTSAISSIDPHPDELIYSTSPI
jgi:hypothetical protein